MQKKRMALSAALVALTVVLVIPARPGTLPTSIIPEGTSWVAHLDMEKFVATKLYGCLEKDGRLEIKNRDITRKLKIDIFKDITSLTIFGLAAGEERIVFAASGRFDKKHLMSLFIDTEDHQEIPYGSYTLLALGKHGFGAFVKDGLFLYADHREDIEKVLDTAAGKAKDFAASKLNAVFKDVSSGAFISGVIEDLTGLGREIRQSKFVNKAKMLLFNAQEAQDSLQMQVRVSADSPESAQDMADMVKGLIAMAKLAQKEGQEAGAASLLRDLQVKLIGNTVSLEFSRPSQEMVDILSHHPNGLEELLD